MSGGGRGGHSALGTHADADPVLVSEVKDYMKAHKLSQTKVGKEARISQAVISDWLSLKYHGHNDKVRTSSSPVPVRSACPS